METETESAKQVEREGRCQPGVVTRLSSATRCDSGACCQLVLRVAPYQDNNKGEGMLGKGEKEYKSQPAMAVCTSNPSIWDMGAGDHRF